MEGIFFVARVMVLVLALAPLANSVLSLYCVIGYFRERRKDRAPKEGYAPPVSILKPVRGVDRGAYENFASYCRVDYPEYELVFAVAEAGDPVVPLIEKLKAEFPAQKIRLVTGIEQIGENRKVNNLCRLVKEAKYELLVMSDSDARVGREYLRTVVAPFEGDGVGCVTSFARGAGGGTLAADLDMLGMCADSVPGAVVARKLEGKVQFAYGWTMATTKKRLAEIGGWEAMANHHSDDFELGNRIAAKGYRVELVDAPLSLMYGPETAKDYLSKELRWAIGLRNVRPAAYVAMIFTLGLPWAGAAAVVAWSAGWAKLAVFYVAAYLVLRMGVTWAAVQGLRDEAMRSKIWLVPVRDTVNAVLWAAGFFTDKIRWRGVEYRVRSKLLVPVGDGAKAK